MKEQINHPDYYQGKIEVIDFIEAHNLNFNIGNVVKYLTRAGKKRQMCIRERGKLTALEKAQWYLSREIERSKSNDRVEI